MNEQALEDFFDKADDVLDDWHGSKDSMSTAEVTLSPYEGWQRIIFRSVTDALDSDAEFVYFWTHRNVPASWLEI